MHAIVLTDPQTNKHSHKPTNRQDRLQYTAPQLEHSVINNQSQQTDHLFPKEVKFPNLHLMAPFPGKPNSTNEHNKV